MNRSTQLKTDPSKVRAWKQRSKPIKRKSAIRAAQRSKTARMCIPLNGGNLASHKPLGLKRGRIKAKPLTPAKRADIKFSLMIRELALWICARCHDNYSTRRDFFDCSHFFRRNKYATRYDPANADGLCRNCHTGKPFPYEEEKHEGGMYYNFMLRKLGEARLESLRQKSESRCKLRDAVEAFEVGQK